MRDADSRNRRLCFIFSFSILCASGFFFLNWEKAKRKERSLPDPGKKSIKERKPRSYSMAPFSLPITNDSYPTSANATFERSLPSAVPCQHVSQSQWGPDSISNIVFGLVMVFISLFAIYQTRRERSRGFGGEFWNRSGWMDGCEVLC